MKKKLQSSVTMWIFLGFAALYILSMGGHGYGGVGTTTYDVTRSMILRGSAAIEAVPWGKVGPDGQFYAQYGVGHSLYNIPFYLIGHFFTRLSPTLAAQYDRLTMFTTLLGQPVISALTCALFFLLCLRLGYSRNTSMLCAVLYGLGTQAWMYAQLDFSEPILTFFLLLSVYWLVRASEKVPVTGSSVITALALAGLFAGMAMSVKIVAAIVLPFFYLYLIFATPGKRPSVLKRVLAFSVPLSLAGFGVVGAYNFLRFGTLLETGYGDEFTFHYQDVLRHFGENLWSLEGSIFLYSPVIVLGIFGVVRFYQRFKLFALFVFGLIGCFFLFYPFTTNELYYGPRYLTPTLPFFLLIAGSWIDSSPLSRLSRKFRYALIISLLFLGSLQQVVGVVVNYHTYYWRIQYSLPLAGEDLRRSDAAQILQKTPKLPHVSGHVWLIGQALRGLVRPGGLPLKGVDLHSDADPERRNVWVPYYGLDFWWCHQKLISTFGLIFPLSIVSILCSFVCVSVYRLEKMRRRS